MVTSELSVESNVSLWGGGGRQRCFYLSSGGLGQRLESGRGQRVSAEVFVRAHSLCDCGGSVEPQRPIEETGRKSMELLETILSLATMFTLAQLSCSVYLSLTPFCLIASDFLSSWASVAPVSSSSSTLRRYFSFSGSHVESEHLHPSCSCESRVT